MPNLFSNRVAEFDGQRRGAGLDEIELDPCIPGFRFTLQKNSKNGGRRTETGYPMICHQSPMFPGTEFPTQHDGAVSDECADVAHDQRIAMKERHKAQGDMIRSHAETPARSAAPSAHTFAWLSRTPFGRPVVPDV